MAAIFGASTASFAAETPTSAPAYRVDSPAIETAELAPRAVGLVSPTQVGLQENFWNGLDFATWEVLLNNLPPTVSSYPLRTLLGNALLSQAATPPSEEGLAPDHGIRAEALMRVSKTPAYNAFIKTIPTPEQTPLLLSRQRDLAFTEGGANACSTLPAENRLLDDMLWRLYCTLAEANNPNRFAEAQLQLALLQERGDQASADVAVAEAITTAGDTGATPAIPASGLNARLVRLIGLSSTSLDKAQSADPLVVRARHFVALEKGGTEGAAAAEWLADSGFIDAATLAEAYSAVPFTEEVKADPNAVNRMKGSQLRAYLWQQLEDASDDADSTRLLADFILQGGASAVTGVRGELLAGYLADIPASAESAWAAPAMFALAASLEVSGAQARWYDTAVAVGDSLPETQKWLARMWPLGLALQLERVDIARLPTWIAIAGTQPTGDRIPVADILTVLEAAGFVIPADIWAKVSDTPSRPTAGQVDQEQLKNMRAAAAASKQGEVILRATALLQGSVADMPAPIAAAVIRALADVGLADVARQLTIETLLHLLYPGS